MRFANYGFVSLKRDYFCTAFPLPMVVELHSPPFSLHQSANMANGKWLCWNCFDFIYSSQLDLPIVSVNCKLHIRIRLLISSVSHCLRPFGWCHLFHWYLDTVEVEFMDGNGLSIESIVLDGGMCPLFHLITTSSLLFWKSFSIGNGPLSMGINSPRGISERFPCPP